MGCTEMDSKNGKNWLSLKILFFVFVIFCSFISSNQKREKKYRLSICSIFKNEAGFLKEWIEYHRLVGVDHFYLYNCGSEDYFAEELGSYLQEGVVTLVDWCPLSPIQQEEKIYRWSFSNQIAAYEHAIHLHGAKETEWMTFVNIDEFLLAPTSRSLIEVLDKYRDYPGVNIECSVFDTQPSSVFPKRYLVIEAIERVKAPWQHPQKKVSKSIFKPDHCKGFAWPPYQCLFKNNQLPITLSKQELCINHYVNRERRWFPKKGQRRANVDFRNLSENEINFFLELGYEVEDSDRVIYRFIPELWEKLRG